MRSGQRRYATKIQMAWGSGPTHGANPTVTRSRPARSAWVWASLEEGADVGCLARCVLQRQPGAGRGPGAQLADRVEAVRARHERLARLVAPDLGGEPVPFVLAHVGQVRNDEVEAARGQSGLHRQLEGQLQPRRVGPGHLHRRGRGVRGAHQQIRSLVQQRERHRARPGANVVHPGPAGSYSATSTSNSVSGRGISTRESTKSSIRRKPRRPRMYATGSRSTRRRTRSPITRDCAPVIARSGEEWRRPDRRRAHRRSSPRHRAAAWNTRRQ